MRGRDKGLQEKAQESCFFRNLSADDSDFERNSGIRILRRQRVHEARCDSEEEVRVSSRPNRLKELREVGLKLDQGGSTKRPVNREVWTEERTTGFIGEWGEKSRCTMDRNARGAGTN